ncbi:two-component system sensor histidine kinase RcsC [Serratia marcescens]|uniref:Sensor histidine kinase RcsC n=1 Tax=Serratia sarumanii TaxID=3020826 RepID=A0ABW8QGS8_9GAMM|nr:MULTISPECIES: two-component system sensor histidine kinase RcsC [Serratia]ASL98515.1 two-component system sensor histidine kinase/response regulator [Serratia marcescens]EGS9995492.1 two-component system sensor histidine kinase RcsC [Serratia marcescens]ELJ5770522.1 two-component system sensor histidine kinase RcsC [Serratia marcescens]ELJ5813877.1 two-component system sensor histidine kinase RcsC [Serratia marcescens]ELN8907417.1 two-component system sensor histidine kinase RcsC [Serratia 
MKYLASFRTTLKISRYLFRVLAILLWSLGALLTTFYILNILHQKESDIRQDYNLNFDQAQGYIRHSADIIRDIKYMAENRLNGSVSSLDMFSGVFPGKGSPPQFFPLYPESNCTLSTTYRSSLDSLSGLIQYWKENFVAAYDLNRVFFIGGDSLCMAEFGGGNASANRENVLKSLHERILKYRNAKNLDKDNNLYWISPSAQRPDVGYLYVLTPLYIGNKLEALLGIEQTVRLEDFVTAGNLPIGVTLLDENNEPVLRLADGERYAAALNSYPEEHAYFGYVDNYRDLILKKALPPSSLSIVYALPVKSVVERFKMLILNALLLNLLSAIVLFTLAWLFERKMFLPAEDNAFRLEEHEQFNRKIVASAPVGICILRISDGTNILSNELAHNYINLLTHEDRDRITRIICEQQANFVDVMTSNNNNLQISFVHSRYRNEEVAICVLVDVSARVKMEESLQEMAAAAEQASQSKSMFLATVSHELRTPLYGIIGNLDLLQTKALPQGVDRLVNAMNNSSGLLLKIISDILDFSKIESEQLKIEPREFSCLEVITHIAGNYLPLVVKKRLGLYCFIEQNVPERIFGDPVRLQQVLSNLVNNAIKFTDTGCIVLQVCSRGSYLEFSVRDTGVGIPEKEISRLFDPFFQVGTGVQRHFQGTGLGLAICEKLVNLMDGDVSVESEPGLGSLFSIRIPLFNAQFPIPQASDTWQGRRLWLDIRNQRLESYLMAILGGYGADIQRYDGQETAAGEVLLSDHPLMLDAPLLAQIQFSTEHIGPSQETRPGYWMHSTSTPRETLTLLNRLFGVGSGAAEALVQLPVPAKASAADNGDIHLLVVDDHPINRRLLSDQLGSLGYQVVTANDGVDALGVLKQHRVDIVLTDVNMPNMDGYRLTQALRQMQFSAPVIGVTANALAEERQRCLEAGMDNCLSKPVTLETLEQTLAYYSQQVRYSRSEA